MIPGGVLEFLKVEGLGNDFLLVDWRGASDWPDRLAAVRRLAPAICDRRRGVGGDGLLVLTPPGDPDADAAMIVVNHDGSRPEMCGNGLRCVALYLERARGSSDRGDRPGELRIETDAGLRPCRVAATGDGLGDVESVMGTAAVLGHRQPAAADGRSFLAVSVGNPHAIAFVGRDEDPESLARRLGPAIEVDPLFPDRTNVEFARLEADGSLLLWVWERGCGITEACGTGACATAAAAVREGLAPADRPIVVRLPGGALRITAPGDVSAPIRMEGPARLVFRGSVDLGRFT
ncbi:MAG: diaminopimelate epimerase [Nannocystaceae bacterium]